MRRALLTLIPLVLVAACGEQEPAPDVRVDPPAVEEQEPVTPDASHDQAVRDAAERTLEAGSVRTESSLHLTDDEDGSLELEFHEHIRFGEVVRVSLSTAGASLMTLAFDGDDVYLTNGTVEDELGEGHWLRLERDEAFAAIDETMLSYLDDVEVTRQMFGGQLVESLLGALAGTDTVDLLGRDIVGGVAATHYLARIDEEQLDRATLQVEVWVGDDGFVRRAETIITSATGRPVVVSVDLHDHGRITDPLVPEAGLTVTAAEHEQRQVAEEDAHADRVDALDGGGLDQATIERLALPRLLPTPGWDDGGPERAFIRHPETEELCWAQRYSAQRC